MTRTLAPTYVIGGGPAGLAVARSLGRRGIHATVLERTDTVGASWRSHPPHLRLHTTRARSSLPGNRIPRRHGRFVLNSDLYQYLRRYAEHHQITMRHHAHVRRVSALAPGRADGARWLLETADGERLLARTVVVATGYNHTPHLPVWPGADAFGGEVIHSRDYDGAARLADRDVLVVGAGNAAAEIATDLVKHGAGRVRLAVRSPPHVVRRTIKGCSSQGTAILTSLLPTRVADRILRVVHRLSVPDLTRHGLTVPSRGARAQLAADGSLPLQDTGSFIADIQAGRIQPVATVASLHHRGARLVDGTLLEVDLIIAATGFRRGLRHLVDEAFLHATGTPLVAAGKPVAPGLYFIGFTLSLNGALRDIGIEARRVARRERRFPSLLVMRQWSSSGGSTCS